MLIEIIIEDCCNYIDQFSYYYDNSWWDCFTDWLWF
jgi:hypothetical protein